MLNYTDITQNTYIQSWTVTDIMASEVWNFDRPYIVVVVHVASMTTEDKHKISGPRDRASLT